ncbi:hypothetical protein PENSPDRAFT_649793 [Peniophora sp. CONT]|nr:hypothetical protein PENSPDRAFT_649793 [Peniophora sp. CONT]
MSSTGCSTPRAARMSFSRAASLSPLAGVYGTMLVPWVMASKHVEDAQVGHAASATPNAARAKISQAPLVLRPSETTQGDAGGKIPYMIAIARASGRSSRQARKPNSSLAERTRERSSACTVSTALASLVYRLPREHADRY